MLILSNYSTNGDARVIEVDDVTQTTVTDADGDDITPRLIATGILKGFKATSTGIIQAGIQNDLTDAIDSFEIFNVDAVVEACPQFNSTTEAERVGVSLMETRHERAGRNGLQEFLTYRIARFLNVPDAGAATAQNCIAQILALVDKIVNIQITQADRVFVVDSVNVEPIDPEQFVKRLIYCGVVDLTLTSARGC